jgi:hypothetical protein
VLEGGLGLVEVRARDLQAALVDLLLGLDLVELDVGCVVGLDRLLEVGIDRLDLGENTLRLRLFLRYRGGARRGREEGGRQEGEKRYESGLSPGRSDQDSPIGTMADAYWGRDAITSAAL